MEPIVEKLGTRLKTLVGDINFKWDDRALDSPDQFLEICAHNSREYEKFEAMNPERQEHIWDLFSNILAVALQKLALDQYGNSNSESIREVLYSRYKQTESQAYWERIIYSAKKCFLRLGLTEKQFQPIMEYWDTLPMVFIEFLVDLTRPWSVIPVGQTTEIASILTDMYKEAEKNGHN